MTRIEFNDLYERLSYGHDAELLIDGVRYFLEWADTSIEIYRFYNETGEKKGTVEGCNKSDTVALLFNAKLDGKCLNNDFPSIQILDIE